MTITYRSEKGSRLTATEVDNNFRDLAERAGALEALPVGTIIDDITISGSTITFHLIEGTGGRDIGPFPLPVAIFRPVGAWLNSTDYHYLDLVSVAGLGTYLVMLDHTTPSAPADFDPDALDDAGTAGDPLYALILPYADLTRVMRDRGAFSGFAVYDENDVFTTPHGLWIVEVAHTAAATFDPDAVSDDETLYRQIGGPIRAPLRTVTDTTFTPTNIDENRYVRCTNASGCMVTVPSSSEVDYAIGAEIHFYAATDGEVTFNTGSDVVINPVTGFDNIIRQRGGVVTIKKVNTDDWDIFGALKDASSGA